MSRIMRADRLGSMPQNRIVKEITIHHLLQAK